MNNAMNFLQLDSQAQTRGAFNLLQTGYSADPRETLRCLLLDVNLVVDPLTTINLENFAEKFFLNWKYIDGSMFVNNVNASQMDFNACAKMYGLVQTGLGDWAGPGIATATTTSYIKLQLYLPLFDPRRRDPLDLCFPLKEIGQLQIQWDQSAGVTLNGGTGIANMQVTAYAISTTEKKVKLGSRSRFEVFNLPSGVTTYSIGGMQLINMQGYYNNSAGLESQIKGGFILYFDSDVVVEGNYLDTLERLDCLMAEPFYAPASSLAATVAYQSGTAAVPIDGGGWMSYVGLIPNKHARVWQQYCGISAMDIEPVNQIRFQCNAPGTNIANTAFVVQSLYPQTDDFLRARQNKLGLQTLTQKLDVTDGSAAAPPASHMQKLPRVIENR